METSSLAPASQDTELANRSRFEGSCDSQKLLGKSPSPYTTSLVLTVVVDVGAVDALWSSGPTLTAMLTGPWTSFAGSNATVCAVRSVSSQLAGWSATVPAEDW